MTYRAQRSYRLSTGFMVLSVLLGVVAPSAQQTPSRRGRVVDAETGAPVRGARVHSLARTVAWTDAEGAFEGVANGTVTIQKAGYVDANLRSLPNGDVRLQRAGVLLVHVIDGLGEPAAGVLVGVKCANRGTSVASDDHGQARLFGLPPGRCTIDRRSPTVMNAGGAPPTREALRAMAEEELKRVRSSKDSVQAGTELMVLAGAETTVLIVDAEAPGPDTRVAQPPTGGGAVIRGRVVNAAGRGVRNTRVELRESGGPPAQAVMTDASGAYAIHGVPAGAYSITSISIALGVGGPTLTKPRQLTVTDGQRLDGIDLKPPPQGIVIGAVRDQFGDPVEGIQVASRPVSGSGSSLGWSSRTDDRGQYRLALEPGAYYVSALLGSANQPDRQVFAPGTAGIDDAAVVNVFANDILNVDIADRMSAGGAVRGTVVDAAGRPLNRGDAVLEGTGEVSAVRHQVAVSSRGTVEVSNLAPGTYSLFVTVPPSPFVILTHQDGRPVGTTQAPVMEFGRAEFDVRSGLTDLTIQVGRGSSLQGRVEIEGASPRPSPATFSFTIRPSSRSRYPPVAIAEDGSFKMTDLAIRTRIGLSVSDGWWLKSFMVNGVNAAEVAVDFAGGAQSSRTVTAVIARLSHVVGTVRDEGKPAGKRGIIAFPLDRDQRDAMSPRVRYTTSDGDGSYRLIVPPGQYWVAAVTPFTGQPPLPNAWLLRLEPFATSVIVPESQPARRDLSLVRLPPE